MVRGEISLNRESDIQKYKIIVIPFCPVTCAKGHMLELVSVDFEKKYIIGLRCLVCKKIYIFFSDYKVWERSKTFQNVRIDKKSVEQSKIYLSKCVPVQCNREYFDRCLIKISDLNFKKDKYGCTHKIRHEFNFFLRNQKRPRIQVYYDKKDYIVYMSEEEFEKIVEEYVNNVHPNDVTYAKEVLKRKKEKEIKIANQVKEKEQKALYWGTANQEPLGIYKDRSPKDERYKKNRSFFLKCIYNSISLSVGKISLMSYGEKILSN